MLILTFYFINQVFFYLQISSLVFRIFDIKWDLNEQPKCLMSNLFALNIMVIRYRHANKSKQTTTLAAFDVATPTGSLRQQAWSLDHPTTRKTRSFMVIAMEM